MKFINLIFFLFLLTFFSCQNNHIKNNNLDLQIIIDIQPFSDFPKNYLDTIYSELKKVYPNIEIKKAIPFPKSSLNSKRTRHRADSLIQYLSKRTPDGHVTIGLTTMDISTTKDNINDYGIMGLGWCPGTSCIASSFRLKKGKKLIQLFKIAIHELGHTQGLQHCPVKTCYMRDAKGKNHTDEETEFCKDCKSKLINAGWTLK